MRVVLLGAGASEHYDDERPSWERPPGSRDILERGMALTILKDPLYIDLLDAAIEFARVRGSGADPISGVDIEDLLAWVAVEFEKDREIDPSLRRIERPFDAQAALEESIYFLYEVLRPSVGTYEPRANAYAKLARSFRREPFGVVSLNYDTIFDIAALRIVGAVRYLPPVPPGALPLAKIHGSVNWLSPLSIVARARRSQTFNPRDVIKHLWSNRLDSPEFYYVAPDWARTHSARDLVPRSELRFEPAMIPPVGKAKDFQKFSAFPKTVEFARQILSQADELVIIGTQIRAQDEVLCSLVKTALARKPDIVAVGNVDKIKARLRDLDPEVKISDDGHFRRFEEFARDL